MFTKEQAIGIIDYLCRDYKVRINTRHGYHYWQLGDGHKHRGDKWVDTTRNVYVPPLTSNSKIVIHGTYICGTVVKESYKNYVLPQIEERRYLPCEFEITWMPRHTKKELSRFNQTVQKQYYNTLTIKNRYLDFKSLLINNFK